MNSSGVDITATPPARASEHSPARSDWQARCSATSEEEHAVSTETAGPSNPSTYATRPDATLPMLPVKRYHSRSLLEAAASLPYPEEPIPANTPVWVPFNR